MAQLALDLAPRRLALHRLAFVVELLALGKPELDLGPPAPEIDFQRDHRVALLARVSPPSLDFAPMHQQLARPNLVVAELSGRRVSPDMNTVEESLAVLDARVAVAQVDLVRAKRFDL